MSTSTPYRNRSAAILWRLSPEDRERVKRLADESKMSVQEYLAWRALGQEPKRRDSQEELLIAL